MAVAAGARAEEGAGASPDEKLALIRADNMRYDPQGEVVSADGHVEIDYRAQHLSADRMVYDQKADKVTADGNVTIIDKDGNVFFSDHAELTDSMREGVINKVRVLFGKNARLAANSAVRHKEIATVFSRAVYSPCNICKTDPTRAPLWQFKARRVTHDKADKEIYFRDAVFELMGYPVAYTPYFSQPDPTVKRKSGFLSPSFGTSSVFGTFLTLPYYWAITDSMDATFNPTFETRDGIAFRGELRQLLRQGQYKVDASIVDTDELNDLNQKTGKTDLRGHLFADGKFKINQDWSWGADIQTTTDDTYLRRYKISDLDRLENNLYIEGINGRNYFRADTYAFQDLRFGDLPGQTPLVAPAIEGLYALQPPGIGGNLNLRASFLSLTRSQGTDVQRFSGGFDWQREFTLNSGQRLTGFASARTDLYVTNNLSVTGLPGSASTSATEGRVLPEMGVEWRWPFVRQFNNVQHVIEPIVQFIYAPKGGNSLKIPNEDSQSLEFDESNLFSADRYPGLDLWEDGARLNYGVRTAAYWGKDASAEIIIGQSHRFLEHSPFADGTGLESRDSDIVGALIIQPRSYIQLIHRFRLDHETLAYQRNETGVNLFFGRLNASASYTSVTRSDTTLLSDSLKAVSASAQLRLTDHWTLNGASQYDLTNNRTVYRQVGVGYLDECISFNILYRQDYTADRDIVPSSSVTFQIRLVNLG